MPLFQRRTVSVLSLALALSALAAPLAMAQAPAPAAGSAPPLRIVVPFAAGGTADIYGRLLAKQWQDAGVAGTVLVENRPGAGGVLGSELVAKAPADGHTLLLVTVGHAVNPYILPKLPYDTQKDFVPVGMLASVPSLLVVGPGFQGQTVKELLAAARSKPGQLEYATSGTGSTSHVAAAQLESMAGVEMLHVPYRGASPAMQDVMGGRVAFTIDVITSSLPHVKSGKLRALAVSSAQRSAQAPEVPTMAEAGVPGYEFTAWYALLAPAQTPPDTLKRLGAALQAALAQPAFTARLQESGATPLPMDRAASAKYLQGEFDKWSRIVKERNIKAE